MNLKTIRIVEKKKKKKTDKTGSWPIEMVADEVVLVTLVSTREMTSLRLKRELEMA
jgi:hypothetical protein